MLPGETIFLEWKVKVEPRVQYIRDAYLASAVLEELTSDAKLVADDWLEKSGTAIGILARQAREEYGTAYRVHLSYETAWQEIAVQMEQIGHELKKLQDERLTLAAMSRTLNIQELGAEVIEKVYGAIGPDTVIDRALQAARQAVFDLDAENRARQELVDFLAHDQS